MDVTSKLELSLHTRRPGGVFALACMLVLLLGLVDYFTGPEWAFSLFYLVPVSLTAWRIGWRAGTAIAILSAAFWLLDEVALHQHPAPVVAHLNTIIRLAFFFVAIWMLSALRASRRREETLRQFIVHDLRGPLANVHTGLQLLERAARQVGSEDRKQERVARLALGSCQRMGVLIDALLDTDRMESGQMPVALEPVDAREIVQAALEGVSLWAQQQRVTLTPEYGTEPCSMSADPALATRVLINLLGNAIKFSPPGSAITVNVTTAGERHLAISVTDRGPGIPRKQARSASWLSKPKVVASGCSPPRAEAPPRRSPSPGWRARSRLASPRLRLHTADPG